MIKASYNKKRFLLVGLVVFSVVSITTIIAVILSSRSFDERSRAISEVAVELSPNHGNITKAGLDIDLILNTHGEKISGVDVTLEFSDTIDYTGFSPGKIENCSVSDVRQGTNKVNLHCFIDANKPTYEGEEVLFASVNFRSLEKGDAKIEVTDVSFAVRDTRNEVPASGTAGNYTTEAEVAITLDPPDGLISEEGLEIDLILDTHNEEVDGIDVTLEYSGDIEYVTFTQGEIEDCNVVETPKEDEDNVINFLCFIEATKPVYEGKDEVFVTVEFKSVHDGSEGVYQGKGKVEITRVDFSVRDDRNEVSFVGEIGEYTTIYTPPVEPPDPQCGARSNTYAFSLEGWASETAFCLEGSPEPSNVKFPGEGETVNWECANEKSTVSCSATRETAPPPPPPSCGSRAQRLPYDSEDWPENTTFCDVGIVDPEEPVFPEVGETTEWECVTDESSISCVARNESAPVPEPEPEPEKEPLPEASIFDNSGILIGLVLVFLSIFLLVYKGKDSNENFSMRNKLS